MHKVPNSDYRRVLVFFFFLFELFFIFLLFYNKRVNASIIPRNSIIRVINDFNDNKYAYTRLGIVHEQSAGLSAGRR